MTWEARSFHYGLSGVLMDVCAICKESDERELRCVTKRGIGSLHEFSVVDADVELQGLLQNSPTTVQIHPACQRDLPRKIKKRKRSISEADDVRSSGTITRSKRPHYSWEDDCLFCGEECKVDKKNPGRKDKHVCIVSDDLTKERLLKACQSRDDIWAENVKHRLLNCTSLVKSKARYHKKCRGTFSLLNKDLSFSSSSTSFLNSTLNNSLDGTPRDTTGRFTLDVPFNVTYSEDRGRPIDVEKFCSFNKVCEWLENETELLSLQDLQDELRRTSNNSDIYSKKWLKEALTRKYDSNIFFAEVNGRSDVICFKNVAQRIVNNLWHEQKKENVDTESRRVIQAAAKLILADVRSAEYDCSFYPTTEDIQDKRMWDSAVDEKQVRKSVLQ